MALDARQIGTLPLLGAFREQRGKFVVNWTSCATFFRPISPFTTARGILLKQSPRSAQSKLDYSEKWQRTTRPVDHEVAGVWDMAGMWVGSCAPSRFAPVLSRCPPSHLHLAPSTLFLLRRNRVLRPAFAWDRGRVIHLILSSQFGYDIPPCEYEVATFVEMEPQPSFMDSPVHPCNNQEAESHRGDKAKGDSIVV